MADRLQVLFQIPGEQLDFIIEYDQVNSSMSSQANSNPSPSGRIVTSSTVMNDDKLRLKGWVRTLNCNGRKTDSTDIIPKLKRFMEKQKYSTEEFATITVAEQEMYKNMTLESVDVDRTYKLPQEMLISMVWRAVNFSGEVTDANFSIGGVQ